MPDHFSEAVHARIYEAASTLIRIGKLASPITLKTYFDSDATMKEIGGPAYLARLAASATTIINAEEYGRMIYELAQRRKLIGIGTDIVNEAFDTPVEETSRDLIERAEQTLYGLAETGKYGQGFHPFARALSDAIDMAAGAYQRDGGLSGISAGLKDLDEKMGGLQSSDLIILAGRPAMGKTALATNIAYNVAKAYKAEHQTDGTVKVTDGGVVAFFSLEMSSEQLATRIIAEQSGISSERIRRGKITEDEFHRIVEVSRELQSLPLYIDATGGLTIAQVAARARRLKRQRGLGLVVVDYLQLLGGSARKAAEGRVQEVSEITVGLKALAKELAVPIVALSQLSRQVENRDDKRPQLADLREVRLHRAGCRRGALHLPRGILPRPQGAPPQHHRASGMAGPDGQVHGCGRSHHRQAAPWPHRNCAAAIRRQPHQVPEPHPRRLPAGAVFLILSSVIPAVSRDPG